MVSYSGAAAVMYVSGIILSRLFDIPVQAIMLAGLFILLVLLPLCTVTAIAKKQQVWILAIVPLCLTAGYTFTEIKTDITRRPLYPYSGNEVEIVGTVSSMPVKYDETSQFMMSCSQVVFNGNTYDVKETIKVSTEHTAPGSGDGIRICGKLKEIDPPKNHTSFDTKSYNMKRGIYFSLFAEEINSDKTAPPLSKIQQLSLFIKESMTLYTERFPLKSIPLLKGIIMNNKSEIPDEVTENMLRTGTYRYIYSPYLHISLIIFLLGRIIGNRRSKFVAGLCILALYLFMNMAVSSAWKICLFFGISYFLTSTFRIADIKFCLYMTVFLTGLISPLTVTEPGFAISIAATVLIRSFSRDMNRIIYPLVRSPKIAGLIGIYLIILAGLHPVSSLFGFSPSPWSFLTGLILSPLTALIYVMFYISFAVYMVSGAVITMGVPQLISVMIFITEAVSKLPHLNTGSCGILFAVTFYLFLYCIYRRLHFRKSIFCEVVTCVLCVMLCLNGIYSRNDTEVTFLSVGNADCALITLPNNKTVMIDGGGSLPFSDYDIAKAEVIPYLNKKGINKIDTIILSHYDKDHADGVVTVIKTVPVREIFLPDYLPSNDYRDIIESEASARGIIVNYVDKPYTTTVADMLTCEFMILPYTSDDNDNSIVARIIYGETSILFTGDISKFAEYGLTDTKADILKVPHHGSKTSNSKLFVQRTDPEYGIICVGANNPYNHPSPEVVSLYEQSGTHVLRTDIHGDIHFIIDKTRIKRVYSFREWFINGKKS